MPTLLQWSETSGCGATIKLDNGDVVYVSVAGARITVRQWDLGNLWRVIASRFFGEKLYGKGSAKKNARAAEALRRLYPEQEPALPQFENPVLSIFANAIWHCGSAAEVARVLGEAAKDTERDAAEDAQRDAANQAE